MSLEQIKEHLRMLIESEETDGEVISESSHVDLQEDEERPKTQFDKHMDSICLQEEEASKRLLEHLEDKDKTTPRLIAERYRELANNRMVMRRKLND